MFANKLKYNQCRVVAGRAPLSSFIIFFSALFWATLHCTLMPYPCLEPFEVPQQHRWLEIIGIRWGRVVARPE